MKKKFCMIFLAMTALLLAGCLTGNSGAIADSETATLLSETVGDSVFEIVALRPVDYPDVIKKKKAEGRESEIQLDTVTYERDIPWQNVDFNARNDEYVAYGTAFAVSENELVTAAHVLELTGPTFFEKLFIRTRDGKVYELDKITRYSHRRDFAFFTVKNSPVFKPLKLEPDYKLNEKVFSVGNALGKGIIFREGLLTSTEKEGEFGAWANLLFSAPASPGNSGGPLLNVRGDVIGIILRKTENENLNYALPVSEFFSAPTDKADLSRQLTYKFINTNRKYGPIEVEESLKLPMSYSVFREKYSSRFIQLYHDMVTGFNKKHGESFFPNGDKAAELFQWVGGVTSLSLIAEGKDGTWGIVSPNEMKSGKLGRSGDISYGEFSYLVAGELRAPEQVKLADLYSDPDMLGDLFLKGYTLNREIGGDSIRITSLGKAHERKMIKDKWGRTWMRCVWYIPFADSAMVLYCLPTPDGFAFIGYIGNYAFAMMDLTVDLEFYLDYVNFTYKGSYKRWQEFMALGTYLPDTMKSVKFDYKVDDFIYLDTDNFQLRMKQDMIDITEESRMELVVSYVENKDKVKWMPTGFSIQAHKNYGDSYLLWRINKPKDFLSEGFHENWLKFCRRVNPYSREKLAAKGSTYCIDIDSGTRALSVEDRIELPNLYLVTVGLEGDKDQSVLEEKLSAFESALKIKEKRD